MLLILIQTGRFDSNFFHILKSNTKFELLCRRYQIFQKIVSTYVLISDFATRLQFGIRFLSMAHLILGQRNIFLKPNIQDEKKVHWKSASLIIITFFKEK